MSFSENWLSLQVSDGIGRNKLKLQTLKQGVQGKPPKVKQLH